MIARERKSKILPLMNADNTDRKRKLRQDKEMKRYHRAGAFVGIAALLVCAFASQATASQATSAQPKAQKAPAKAAAPLQTFVGIITDGQCAVKGSHKEVMAKAKVNTRANCVKGCARRYGYVLYVPSTKKIYKLSDRAACGTSREKSENQRSAEPSYPDHLCEHY